MERWSGILRVPLSSNGSIYHRVGASLCLSPASKALTVPSANAIFFCGDRVEGTGNPVIVRLSDLQRISEILVSKFGGSTNVWVIEASVFNGPFAIYKGFIPSLNQWGEPKSYSPATFPSSASLVSILSSSLEEVKKFCGRKIAHGPNISSFFFVDPRTIILGFSKGGTVVNQLVTELGFLNVGCDKSSPLAGDSEHCGPEEDIPIVPSTKEKLLNSINEIHYVDVGLNSCGAYLNDHDVIRRISKRLTERGSSIRFVLHGTPRQWCDKMRPWIRDEMEKLINLLEFESERSRGKLQVCKKFYFAERPSDMQMHFEIIQDLDVS